MVGILWRRIVKERFEKIIYTFHSIPFFFQRYCQPCQGSETSEDNSPRP